MGARSSQMVYPVGSRRYSSESEVVLVVRRRPQVVNGGGFIVSNSKQQVVFRVDGCGVLGTKGKLLLRNSDGDSLLLIRKMGGILQALNTVHKKWEGFGYDKEGAEKLVFNLKGSKRFMSGSKRFNQNFGSRIISQQQVCGDQRVFHRERLQHHGFRWQSHSSGNNNTLV